MQLTNSVALQSAVENDILASTVLAIFSSDVLAMINM